VLRSARYDDRTRRIGIGEVHLFVGPQFVITVRHSAAPDLSAVRDALEAEPRFLGTQVTMNGWSSTRNR
jgi:magnesium transporter